MMIDTTTAPNDSMVIIQEWRSKLKPVQETLQILASATEDEFLQIGSRLQDFYVRSAEMTSMANRLVEAVSGEQVQPLVDRLRQMIGDMQAYLQGAGRRTADSCTTLQQILDLLEQVTHPLDSYQKMTKVLRMLGISTKIESSRLGDVGFGFLTLAMDVERLSHLVSDKSSSILVHRHGLSAMIADNLRLARSTEAIRARDLEGMLENTSHSLDELLAVNTRCATLGSMISSVSGEVSENISEVVSSMQMHDMTRQQVEHIIEALGHLLGKLSDSDGQLTPELFSKLVIEAGDVCELQEAQLRFATSELCGAVGAIVENLRDVASKQVMMADEALTISGAAGSDGDSFVDAMRKGMSAVTMVLLNCTKADREMSATLTKVAETMQEITGFVTDIEDIGLEIDLIALNSQIKAAHTGREGAALGVLAEAIKRLSVDAVIQTESVAGILTQINQFTSHLSMDSSEETRELNAKVDTMQEEVTRILSELGTMNDGLAELLIQLNGRVAALTHDIEQATSGIDVHHRVSAMADEAMSLLDGIVRQARALQPASSEFKDNLRHMEARYTMQSERHIHESIARKRSGASALPKVEHKPEPSAVADDSGFGDNVDLF